MKPTSDAVLIALPPFGLVLVLLIALRYSYDTLTHVESALGALVLVAASAYAWTFRRRSVWDTSTAWENGATFAGWVLGMVWLVEICVNNIAAPPLPGRDIFDNIVWAVIALAIFALCVFYAWRTRSVTVAIQAGARCGFISGLVACCTALALIVFAMPFITRDPLNLVEWARWKTGSGAPSMAAYFAYETFAGAFLHLLVLGIGMGGVLGVFAGLIGKFFWFWRGYGNHPRS
jgi:hypothetical protein